MININLENEKQHTLASDYIDALALDDRQIIETFIPSINITAMVDGRGLACPMPLLKTKVALRSMQTGESVYVLATDPNSQNDLAVFCQQSGLDLILSTHTEPTPVDSLEKLDTIFHVFITKTNGN